MKKPRTLPKTRRPEPSEPATEDGTDVIDARRRAMLENQYRDSRAAFTHWETAQARTDQQLYEAIGRLAEFVAAVGNEHQALTEFAATKGVRATKASSLHTVVAKLVVTSDRRKASKYATVLHLAARRGVELTAESVATFIKDEGGIEACLRSFRELPRDASEPKRQGRPSAFGKAVAQLASFERTAAPADLEITAVSGSYFLVVGVRGEDGTMQLLRQPVTDDALVQKAVVMLVPKG